jgi:hypothetical protein
LARKYVDITKEHSIEHKDYTTIQWNPEFNKDHILNFYIDIALWSSTNSWKFYDVDYSKGVFIAANTNKAYHQWADVYYYSSIDGSAISQHVDYIA